MSFTFAAHHFEYYSDVIIGHVTAKVGVAIRLMIFFPPNLDNVLGRKKVFTIPE